MARRIVLAHKPKPSLAFLFKRDEGQAAVLLKQAVHASWEIAFKKDKTTL